ncbi:Ni/Fe hydrogenase, partial [Helicobacter pylori]|uniref:twin-arginine translocation signal domain-containing protein n=1 Tax=Helicobacter pylori TaxID=210 RepID=UPI000D4383A5
MFYDEKKTYQRIEERLEVVSSFNAHNEHKNLQDEFKGAGISRRDLLKWAGMMSATLALPASFAPLTLKAVEVANRLPVVWLHMAECTGCSESLLRSADPTIDS